MQTKEFEGKYVSQVLPRNTLKTYLYGGHESVAVLTLEARR